MMRDPIRNKIPMRFSKLKKFNPISEYPLRNRDHNREPNFQVFPKRIEIILGRPFPFDQHL